MPAMATAPEAARRARRPARWATLVGFIGLTLVAIVWLWIDRHPPEWDYANHLERAVRCAQGIQRGDWDAVLGHSPFYPPLVLCATGLVYLIAPTDVAAGAVVMLAALGLGMFATYLLAQPSAGDSGAAVAALLYGTAPYVVLSTVQMQLDLPLAAMAALALVVIREADGLGDSRWALLTGAVLGLGMLTKPSFGLYVAPALIWLLRGMRDWRGAANGILLLGVGMVLALPWYGPRLFGLPSQFAWRAVSADETRHLDPRTWEALLQYPGWLPSQFGVAATALFLVGLLAAFYRRRWWLLGSLACPFLVLEALRNKNMRYTLPLLPLAAVVSAIGWRALPSSGRLATAAALGVVAVLQIGATAFDHPHAAHVPGLGVALGIPSPPLRSDWPQRDILALIARDSGGRPATVSVVPNHPFFSLSNFSYFARRDGLALQFSRAWGDQTPLGIEYVILKTGDVGPPWTEARIRRATASIEAPAGLGRVFPVIGRFALPDGSEATVRARRLTAISGASAADVAEAAQRAFWRWIADFARDLEGASIHVRYDEGAREGRIRRVELSAARATFAEFLRPRAARLRMRNVQVSVEDALINPHTAVSEARLELLSASLFRLERAMITAEDLAGFLAELPKLQTQVTLESGALAVTVRQFGPDVTGRVRVVRAPGDLPIALVPEGVRVGRLAIPDGLVDWVTRQYDPTGRIARRLAMPVKIGQVTIQADGVTISGE
jgi:Dolichyl-phosphate-mannose-protein mannosyltransferase/LmeA-like phospholipid-binding